MKIRFRRDASLTEDSVEVNYREETEKITVIRDFFSSFQSITGKKENTLHKIYPGSIYYLEVVERKLFACQEKEVYQLEYSMRDFLERFSDQGFVQIGKSMLVNLYKVDCVKADLNMKLRLLMDNGEVLVLNRTYKKTFLEAIGKIKADYLSEERQSGRTP